VHVITAVEPVRGRLGGCRVEVEGREPFRVADDLRRQWRLEPGTRLASTELDAIVTAAAAREALDRAVLFLSYRPRTCREVRRHLSDHGLGGNAESAVARCRELGYLDDERYAQAYVRERLRLKPRGRVRLVSELLARGIDRTAAERVVDDVLMEEEVTEASLVRDVAAARLRRLRGLDPDTAKRRLSGYLARRGFAAGDIRDIVRELVPDDSND